jgi:Tol biopolymer transport system component
MRWVVIALCAGCGLDHGQVAVQHTPDSGTTGGSNEIDAAMPPPFATGPFGMAVKVTSLSSAGRDDDITLTGDMLEIFWESDREVAYQSDIWTARRAKVTDPWSIPSKVTELSTPFQEGSLELSPDGLTLYFASDRGTSQTMDVYVATRVDRGSPWKTPQLVSSLSSTTANDYDAQPWGDTVIYLSSARSPSKGGGDVFRATRQSPSTPTWNAPATIPGLDTNMYEGEAFADATGAVWFTGNGAGDEDIYRAESDGNGKYKTPQIVLEICGPAAENDAWLSPDGHTIYFTSNRNSASLDIYMATR